MIIQKLKLKSQKRAIWSAFNLSLLMFYQRIAKGMNCLVSSSGSHAEFISASYMQRIHHAVFEF